jgi:phosphomannomutase
LLDTATPTPVISHSVVAHGAAGAVNITASHNPHGDCGFKVRDHDGAAIDPDGLLDIEDRIPALEGVKRLELEEAVAGGKVEVFDPAPVYLEHLATLIDVAPIRQAGLSVVVDAMWGNGAGWFSRILAGGQTRVTEIHHERNPLFPEMQRPEPIPPNVDVGLAKITELGADVLVINDGDADRVGFGDEHGNFIDQLRAYGLLALYLLEVRGQRGPIVKTLSTTSMLDKLGALYDVPVYETGVGFKYVAPKIVETDALIGGEESGGYAFRGNVPERDGILAGLCFLDFMVQTGKKPSQLIEMLFDKVGPHYYERVDTSLDPDQKEAIRARVEAAHPDKIAGLVMTGVDKLDGYKFNMQDGGWLLVRFSGTEPLIRVYCETTHADKVQAILNAGLEIAGLA